MKKSLQDQRLTQQEAQLQNRMKSLEKKQQIQLSQQIFNEKKILKDVLVTNVSKSSLLQKINEERSQQTMLKKQITDLENVEFALLNRLENTYQTNKEILQSRLV